MTETSGEAPLNNNELRLNNVADPTQELLIHIQEMIVKNQNEQKKFNEDMLEKMLEKMRSTEAKINELSKEQQKLVVANNGMQTKTDNLSEVQQKISISSSEKSGGADQKNKSIDNKTSSSSIVKTGTSTAVLPATGKSFVLKHVFKNVMEMKEGEHMFSEDEENFGVPWKIQITREEENLGFFLHCLKSKDAGKWSIEMEKEQEILSAYGGKSVSYKVSSIFGSEVIYSAWGRDKFIKWEEMEKNYIKDGKMTAEVHVKINKMTGIYKNYLRSFDQSMVEFSDVVLGVEDSKFHVSKLYLATHSKYFTSLFLGSFQESNQTEIKLSGIDSDDFQNYLEVLYCEDAIDETTVEGILLVADMYDTPIVIKKCQQFLLEKSGKMLKKKLLMSARYSLEQLKKKCISEIKSTAEIKSILPDDIEEMDHSITAELLKKSLEFK